MKTFLLLALGIFASCHAQGFSNVGNSLPRCPDYCKDAWKMCKTLQPKMCHQSIFGSHCQKTCNPRCYWCTPSCSHDCKDTSLYCRALTNPQKQCEASSMMGRKTRESCPATCRYCVPCSTNSRSINNDVPCVRDCTDLSPNCFTWGVQGACRNKDPWMMKNCRNTCKTCTVCLNGKTLAELKAEIEATRPPPTTTTTTTTTASTTTIKAIIKPKPMPMETFVFTRPSTPAATTTTEKPKNYRCNRNKKQFQSVKEQCESAHQYYRCLHNAQPLFVDDPELEQLAQQYADYKAGKQTSNPLVEFRMEEMIGANTASSSSSDFSVDDAVTQWYADGLGYLFGDYFLPEETKKFTQLIWKETEFASCAVSTYKGMTHVVALYKYGGNDVYGTDENLEKPIPDVQYVDCGYAGAGACQAHDNNQGAACLVAPGGVTPTCKGHCVVICDRPFGYDEEWRESCEGNTLCTCNTAAKGAICTN